MEGCEGNHGCRGGDSITENSTEFTYVVSSIRVEYSDIEDTVSYIRCHHTILVEL